MGSEKGDFIPPPEPDDRDERADALPAREEFWKPPTRFGSHSSAGVSPACRIAGKTFASRIAGGTPALLWGGMKSPFSGPIATSSAFGFLCEFFFHALINPIMAP